MSAPKQIEKGGTMKQSKHHNICLLLSYLILLISVFSSFVFAAEVSENTKYYLGEAVNTGEDNGYSGNKKIKEDDPHFGWKIGSFFVSGYTRSSKDDAGDPLFLKTVGDTITLWFHLDQDIKKLNGDDMLTISKDDDGYDEYFGIEKTNFGKGTLIIKHTDYQNHAADPVIYTDYLAAHAVENQDVKVELFEEGDYEVALNYEIREDNLDIFGWNPFPSYYNYRIFFRFSVRNGNCMVYPFDIATREELLNSSSTENGFYLDLARSRYLDIDIKKEVLNEGADGLTEDVRFNRPAKDGDQYTDEGIYTITVSNRYTNQQTVKKIYVGTNDILKAHVTTGYDISEISYQLSMGATIAEDGTMIPAPEIELPPTGATEDTQEVEVVESIAETTPTSSSIDKQSNAEDPPSNLWILFAVLGAVILLVVLLVLIAKKRRSQHVEEINVGGEVE